MAKRFPVDQGDVGFISPSGVLDRTQLMVTAYETGLVTPSGPA